MTVDYLVAEAQIFLLIFARVLVFVEIAPLLNSSAIPQIAKIGLAFFIATAVLPWVVRSGVLVIPDTGLQYAFMLIGEILIGIITAFFLVIIMAVFQLAGQFFSTQMGFASSQCVRSPRADSDPADGAVPQPDRNADLPDGRRLSEAVSGRRLPQLSGGDGESADDEQGPGNNDAP